ncbi:MAG TPA: hypothetical protein VEY08_14030, partial [Chloroflexia bacterium]|nr:hypothetical protein [Chloroflexia bacterium]
MTPPESPTSTPISGPYNEPAQPVEWPWKLFFTFLGLFALTSRGHTGSIDEESLLYASSRIVQDALGMLGIAWSMPDPPLLGMRLFTTYEPGQPLLAVPFYLAGSLVASIFPLESHTYVTRLVATFFGAVVTAATIARLYQCGRVLGQGSTAATFMAATYGIGTLAWPYARTLFREPLTGFALLSAAYALVRLHERPGWRPAVIGWGWVLLAVMTKLAAVFTVPIFALYFAGRHFRRRRSASGAGGSKTWARVRSGWWRSGGVIAVAVTVLIVVLAALVFQNRWKQLGPYLSQTGLFTGDFSYVPVAFYGLTLSPGKGLLVFAPPVLAGLVGLYLLLRQRRAEALLFAGLFAVFLGVYSFNTSWHG